MDYTAWSAMYTTPIRVRNGLYCLRDFDPSAAPVVAGWARDAAELFWLAPSTPPPLTAAKVLGWQNADVCALLFQREASDELLGYLELNLMPAQTAHLWMGHCVIAPSHRGQGLGRMMVSMAMEHAFTHRKAESVSLIVFPDNVAAIECYKRVGFAAAGEQLKDFRTTGRTHRMLRMLISRQQYA
ncbi:MAG TPA: GNAT family N-acetyltransferase [Phycisphaerae bacterium]|nr:GNAT family N-acetyltransferase [Phycisphaerae bacterium]